MKIAVLTDSSAAISKKEAQALKVTVLHLPLSVGGKIYHEGLDISDDLLIKQARLTASVLSLGQNSLAEIDAVINKLAQAGYDACLAIHLASGLSALGDSLQTYAQKKNCPIKLAVFDARTSGLPLKRQVEYASQLVQAGEKLDDILLQLAVFRKKQATYLLINDMKPLLQKGSLAGHVPGVIPNKALMTFDQQGKLLLVDHLVRVKPFYEAIMADFKRQLAAGGQKPLVDVMFEPQARKTAQKWVQIIKTDLPTADIKLAKMRPSLVSYSGPQSILFALSVNDI